MAIEPKLLSDEQLKHLKKVAETHLLSTLDVQSLFAHIDELNRQHFCKHNWEYHFEVGFVCGKCDLKRSKR